MAKNKRKTEMRATRVETQDVPVTTHEPPVEERKPNPRLFWPKSKPLPGPLLKVSRGPRPCPSCRRLRLDDLSQAVVCTSSARDVAWFRCKACGHRFPVTVKEIS